MGTVIAAAQATPVFLDRDATLARVDEIAGRAAASRAALVVFPEAFVPAYPDWVWRTPAWSDSEFTRRLYAQAVAVPSAATDRLCEIARAHGVWLAVGVDEIDGGTLYNTLLFVSPAGDLAGRHRKLVPTGGERTVWGGGDGSTLSTVTTPFGVLGGLICWENYMPLARSAMYALGVQVYAAPTWDNSDVWLPTLRHIAKEGRCYVVGVAPVLRGSDVPGDLRGSLYGGDDDWMSRGGSAIVDPYGTVLAGPVWEREEVLYAEIDPDVTLTARREFDPVGHYARPDVFTLSVATGAQRPVTFV